MHLGRVPSAGPEAFLTDLGRTVLGPLLYVARATGLSMGNVERLSHPDHLGDTLAFVSAILDSLQPAAGADDLQRDWALIAEEEARLRRMGFLYAYGMVRHWQLSTGWPWPAAPRLGEKDRAIGQLGRFVGNGVVRTCLPVLAMAALGAGLRLVFQLVTR